MKSETDMTWENPACFFKYSARIEYIRNYFNTEDSLKQEWQSETLATVKLMTKLKLFMLKLKSDTQISWNELQASYFNLFYFV